MDDAAYLYAFVFVAVGVVEVMVDPLDLGSKLGLMLGRALGRYHFG